MLQSCYWPGWDNGPMDTAALELSDNPARSRYEARTGGEVVGFAEYRLLTGAVMFTHTEVSEAAEGQGIGSKLVRYALEDVRSKGLYAIPMCPFVSAFIQRHREEYIGLVNPPHRRIFGL
nr:GNAT family N-acetyltransferase [Calidithermus terrae]